MSAPPSRGDAGLCPSCDLPVTDHRRGCPQWTPPPRSQSYPPGAVACGICWVLWANFDLARRCHDGHA